MKDSTWLKITPKNIESNDLSFNDAFELLFSTLRQCAMNFLEEYPEAKDDIYDWINQASSGILMDIDPDQDPNPDLDINEVIAMQDLYINENLAALKQNNPRLYKKARKQLNRAKSDQRAKILEMHRKQNLVNPDGSLNEQEQLTLDDLQKTD